MKSQGPNGFNFNDLKACTHTCQTPTCTIHVVVDSVENGIAIGGMRIIPEASVQETAELARAMTQKLKLFGVPVGGAKALVAPRRGYSFADMREDIAEIMQPCYREN